jgi:hypothetical protein
MTYQMPDYSTKGNNFLYGSQLSDALFANKTAIMNEERGARHAGKSRGYHGRFTGG